MPAGKEQLYFQALVDSERPARMVGLFTGQSMKPHDLQRLVSACINSMRQEDAGASLTVSPLGGPSPQEFASQRTWRVTVVDGADASPQDCLVQVFDMRDPESPHRALLDHIGGRDQELSEAASHLQQNAQTYLSIASGKLDQHGRGHRRPGGGDRDHRSRRVGGRDGAVVADREGDGRAAPLIAQGHSMEYELRKVSPRRSISISMRLASRSFW
jgi:hypothetical protein